MLKRIKFRAALIFTLCLLLLPLSLFADGVQKATEEDMAAFDLSLGKGASKTKESTSNSEALRKQIGDEVRDASKQVREDSRRSEQEQKRNQERIRHRRIKRGKGHDLQETQSGKSGH